MEKKIKVAFATNDGNTYNDTHFGDSDYYDLYELSETEAVFLERITNTVDEEEEVHADPKKAKGIMNLLVKNGVHTVISKVFGPNIKRIKKKFVCILMNNVCLDDSISFLCKNLESVHNEWAKGEERKHLDFRKK
ncbi:MAG: dinitrogenase iron-molybdenum cofactor biosynthesis protein [Candidatus Marinimicrobia bacterium]|nr:dinitrogenase iron-molybdenum cofactor biosynthesis protein [Candidatus Neomarinimicrobiota bacterium]